MSVLSQMDSGRQDIILRRGVTDSLAVSWMRSSDGGATFQPVDLSAWTGALELLSTGGEVWLSKPVMLDEFGMATVAVDPADTSDLVWAGRASGVWRIDATDVDGYVERLASGYFFLEA